MRAFPYTFLLIGLIGLNSVVHSVVFAGGGAAGDGLSGSKSKSSVQGKEAGAKGAERSAGPSVSPVMAPQGTSVVGVSGDSPIVYRQMGYLGTIGPAPMRFGPATPGCNERTPPRVAANSKKSSSVSASATFAPPPMSAVSSSAEGLGLGSGVATPADSRMGRAEEVLSFFSETENVDAETQRRKLRFLFDPVPSFQSATPPPLSPAPTNLPPSSATFRQN